MTGPATTVIANPAIPALRLRCLGMPKLTIQAMIGPARTVTGNLGMSAYLFFLGDFGKKFVLFTDRLFAEK
jgi:hypothetical protein